MNANDETSVKIEVKGPPDGLSDSEIQKLRKVIASNDDVAVSESVHAAPKDAKSPHAVINTITGLVGVVVAAIGIWCAGMPEVTIIIEVEEIRDSENPSGEEYEKIGQTLDNSTSIRVWRRHG